MPATKQQFQTAAERPGYLKLRLRYNTWAPKHLRSAVLKDDFKVPPPYREDVCVFMRPEEVTMDRTDYEPIFQRLLEEGIVAAGTRTKPQLVCVELLDEDAQTLAYFSEES